MDADQLDSFVVTDWVGPEENKRVKAVTSSASTKDNIYTVTLTNADLDNARTVTVKMEGLEKISSASAVILEGEKMNSMNTFEKPDAVVEKKADCKVDGNVVTVTLKPRSVLALQVKA